MSIEPVSKTTIKEEVYYYYAVMLDNKFLCRFPWGQGGGECEAWKNGLKDAIRSETYKDPIDFCPQTTPEIKESLSYAETVRVREVVQYTIVKAEKESPV